MSTKVTRARARRDAAEAVHTLADAGRILAGSAASSVGDTASDLSGALAVRVDRSTTPGTRWPRPSSRRR